ncbi:MAG: agmatinase [Planctomycetota bacterium]
MSNDAPTLRDDHAGDASDGIFGIDCAGERAAIVLTPAPVDATTTYGRGTAAGPAAIREASAQLDLADRRFGDAWRAGIYMDDAPPGIIELAEQADRIARPIIARGGATGVDHDAIAQLDAIGDRITNTIRERTAELLTAGKVPGLIGGEHSVSLGAIQAVAAHHGSLGVLQIDAHLDLRRAYLGMKHSHASVMHNVVASVPTLDNLVAVGVRDVCREELDAINADRRLSAYFDDDIADRIAAGENAANIWHDVISDLPNNIYISFDIDGLDPSLCPSTGTPVPGGLTFRDASQLLHAIVRAGKRIVGFDLVEVAPGPTECDANVGARILYRLCGAAALSNGIETRGR